MLGAGEDIYDGRGGGFVSGVIELGDGADTFSGGHLDETASGGGGVDEMTGGRGEDMLNGDGGNDVLRGGRGNDEIKAGTGNDTIYGDRGNDDLTGGSGNDIFVFKAGFGHDTIHDFRDTNAEKIDLSDVAAVKNINDLRNNHLSNDGPDAIITVGENTIRLDGFAASDLGNGDFIFDDLQICGGQVAPVTRTVSGGNPAICATI